LHEDLSCTRFLFFLAHLVGHQLSSFELLADLTPFLRADVLGMNPSYFFAEDQQEIRNVDDITPGKTPVNV
jgi:hypothetical protein